jgi:hypothetical protein
VIGVTRRPTRLRRRSLGVRPRFALRRLVAIVAALLALMAQQRVVESAPLVAAPEARVVALHAPRAESHALRVEASVRVARAPLLTRLPLSEAFLFATSCVPSERGLFARAACVEPAQVVTHFHAKRRIPRMNTEEPPRA